MADYKMTLRQAIWEIPLTAAFALRGPRAARNGIEVPGPADLAAAEARRRVKDHYRQNFQIVD